MVANRGFTTEKMREAKEGRPREESEVRTLVDAPRGPTASTVVCHRWKLTVAWWMDQGNHLYDDIWQHELKPEHFSDELAISQSLLYLIRLNSPTLSLLKRRLNQPATDKLRQRLWSESGRILSLPIRGSDKCGEEMFVSGGGHQHLRIVVPTMERLRGGD